MSIQINYIDIYILSDDISFLIETKKRKRKKSRSDEEENFEENKIKHSNDLLMDNVKYEKTEDLISESVKQTQLETEKTKKFAQIYQKKECTTEIRQNDINSSTLESETTPTSCTSENVIHHCKDEQIYQANIDSFKKQKDLDTVDVEDSDDYLLYLEEILRRLHSYFYELYIPLNCKTTNTAVTANLPDLKEIVPAIRKKVLADTHLVFSGIVPQNINLKESKAFHIATSLGATVSERIVPRSKKDTLQSSEGLFTTHVVAANLHTEKVHQAKRLKHVLVG